MQTYIQDNNLLAVPIKEFRPNYKKIFVRTLIIMIIVLILIIALLIFFNNQVGFDTFTGIFEELGMTVNPSEVLVYTIAIAFFIILALLLGSYLNSKNVKYVFYNNKFVFYETQALILMNSKEVPYQNITKIYFNNNGLMDKLLGYGDIFIEISGMKDNALKLDCIDDVEDTVQYIQRILYEYNAYNQMRFEQNQRIGNIMSRF